ncbi:hypothetical protein GWI33_013494 [Rhynchophorus ferrugineus]|uniref:Uncharacterized protein n=1 Tax=Rhynchophorus ferrugineus TaxID=354439 RepID=A0A834I3M1_RHYFE|nr:hypothetical protein GWI33_013494 [Rhynchophorus ferrugineus]
MTDTCASPGTDLLRRITPTAYRERVREKAMPLKRLTEKKNDNVCYRFSEPQISGIMSGRGLIIDKRPWSCVDLIGTHLSLWTFEEMDFVKGRRR